MRMKRDERYLSSKEAILVQQHSPNIHDGPSSEQEIISVHTHHDKQRRRQRAARTGDVVTVEWHLEPENGYVPDSLFDSSGRVSFVLGWGNYLPGLHAVVVGMRPGESRSNISIDAGWGKRRDDLIVKVPRQRLVTFVNENDDVNDLQVGQTLHLRLLQQTGLPDVIVSDILQDEEDSVVLDGNPPLAGTSYACSLQVLNVETFPQWKMDYYNKSECDDHDNDNKEKRGLTRDENQQHHDEENDYSANDGSSNYEVATFALGCFWGAELAYMRVPGVVGTKVGYSQGLTMNPTYEQVSTGGTKHREAVQVVYNPTVISYQDLCQIALDRLGATTSPLDLHRMFQEKDDMLSPEEEEQQQEQLQYRHGFYYHNEAQRTVAEELISSIQNKYCIELLQAKTFFDAEEYHQQYLYKGGQSTRKGCKDVIRCYG